MWAGGKGDFCHSQGAIIFWGFFVRIDTSCVRLTGGETLLHKKEKLCSRLRIKLPLSESALRLSKGERGLGLAAAKLAIRCYMMSDLYFLKYIGESSSCSKISFPILPIAY